MLLLASASLLKYWQVQGVEESCWPPNKGHRKQKATPTGCMACGGSTLVVMRGNLRRGGGRKLSPVPASLVAGLLDGGGKFSSTKTVFPFVLAKGEASMGWGLYFSGSSKGREEPPVLICIRFNMGTTSSHPFRRWL